MPIFWTSSVTRYVADPPTTNKTFLPTCSSSTCFRFNSTHKGSILYTIHTTPQTTISSNPPAMPFCKTKKAIGGDKKKFSQKNQFMLRCHFLNLFSPMLHHSLATGRNSMIKHEYFGHLLVEKTHIPSNFP